MMGDLPPGRLGADGDGNMRPTMLQPGGGGGGQQQRGMAQQQQQQQQGMQRPHMLQGLGLAGRPQSQQYAPRAQGGFNPAQLST